MALFPAFELVEVRDMFSYVACFDELAECDAMLYPDGHFDMLLSLLSLRIALEKAGVRVCTRGLDDARRFVIGASTTRPAVYTPERCRGGGRQLKIVLRRQQHILASPTCRGALRTRLSRTSSQRRHRKLSSLLSVSGKDECAIRHRQTLRTFVEEMVR